MLPVHMHFLHSRLVLCDKLGVPLLPPACPRVALKPSPRTQRVSPTARRFPAPALAQGFVSLPTNIINVAINMRSGQCGRAGAFRPHRCMGWGAVHQDPGVGVGAPPHQDTGVEVGAHLPLIPGRGQVHPQDLGGSGCAHTPTRGRPTPILKKHPQLSKMVTIEIQRNSFASGLSCVLVEQRQRPTSWD